LTAKRTACALKSVAISEADNIMLTEREASIVLQRWWETQSYLLRLHNSSFIDISVYHSAATKVVS
jgi:hypothetical protein